MRWSPKVYNDGIAHIGLESDPFSCGCMAYVQFVNKVAIPEVDSCIWHHNAQREINNLTQNARSLPENIAAIALVRDHRRVAFNLQAGGYKGSTHPKAVERAKKERDLL